MKRKLLFLLAGLSVVINLTAQSAINFTVKFNFQQITGTDLAILETLERDVVAFLNGTPWTEDKFEPEERINCTIIITVAEGSSTNSYEADLAIQSSRPIYGTGEETAVFNYLDGNVNFYYEQFQAIQLSENSYTGNLPAILGFYVNMVLGFDYETFSPSGGQAYFEKAQDIFNRLPADVSNDDPGWRSQTSRNRFWLLENITSPRVLPLRRALYTYHLEGLDVMHKNVLTGRSNILLAIDDVQKTNQSYPGSIITQVFVDAKREEIIEIFKGAPAGEQNQVIQIMSRLDPSNSGKYRDIRSRGTSVGRQPVPNQTVGKPRS